MNNHKRIYGKIYSNLGENLISLPSLSHGIFIPETMTVKRIKYNITGSHDSGWWANKIK